MSNPSDKTPLTSNATPEKRSPSIDSPAEAAAMLRRFAFRVAGPRDFVINLVINGTIAWWIFGARAETPLTGSPSIFSMLLPMAYIESALTTFFGYVNGFTELRKKCPDLAPSLSVRHVAGWIGWSTVCGCTALLVAFASEWLLSRIMPDVSLRPWQVVATIGTISAFLALGLHSRAVLHEGRALGRP